LQSPQTLTKVISEPLYALLDRGGKAWRSILVIFVAQSLGKSIDDVLDITILPEIIHNGSLIIDDIEDSSDFRRGAPCLHKIEKYGIDVSINVGNFMYFIPLKVIENMQNNGTISAEIALKLYRIYSKEMANLHLGQGLDICWHKGGMGVDKEPNINDYLLMCANKTGGLSRMRAKLGATMCGATNEQVEAFGKFAESVGIAFQIQDDLLNIDSENELAIKKGGVGEDIHEGKRSIMVIHCIKEAPKQESDRLLEILNMKTSDPKLIEEAIQIMKKKIRVLNSVLKRQKN